MCIIMIKLIILAAAIIFVQAPLTCTVELYSADAALRVMRTKPVSPTKLSFSWERTEQEITKLPTVGMSNKVIRHISW